MQDSCSPRTGTVLEKTGPDWQAPSGAVLPLPTPTADAPSPRGTWPQTMPPRLLPLSAPSEEEPLALCPGCLRSFRTQSNRQKSMSANVEAPAGSAWLSCVNRNPNCHNSGERRAQSVQRLQIACLSGSDLFLPFRLH